MHNWMKDVFASYEVQVSVEAVLPIERVVTPTLTVAE